MRSRRWRSFQSGLPESAHGSPELVKHASLVEVGGMSRNTEHCCSESGLTHTRIQRGHPYQLDRVTTAVSNRYYLAAQTHTGFHCFLTVIFPCTSPVSQCLKTAASIHPKHNESFRVGEWRSKARASTCHHDDLITESHQGMCPGTRIDDLGSGWRLWADSPR
jgi:hypothetical protein